MEMAPNSFSMTTTRFPWSPVRMRLTRVVLPLPRKPLMIVIGIRAALGSPPDVAVHRSSDFWLIRRTRSLWSQATRR